MLTMAEDLRRTESKYCGVCGDKALGYNFNAITCESCKAFFRRNALKTKEFKCPFNNSCKVDVVTRRFCQKCRLKKCFEIGMKKEWIMTDEEKRIKRAKIEENRHKRHLTNIPTTKDTVIKVESPDAAFNQLLLSPAASLSPVTPVSASCGLDMPKRVMIHQPLTPSDYEGSPPPKVLHNDNSLDVHTEFYVSSEEGSEMLSAHSDTGSNFDVTELNAEGSTEAYIAAGTVTKVPVYTNDKVPRENVDTNSVEESPRSPQVVPLSLSPSPFTSSQVSQVTSSTVASESSFVSQAPTTSGVQSNIKVQSPTLSSCSDNSDSNFSNKGFAEISNFQDSVLKIAVETEFANVPIRTLSSSLRELSEVEKSKINELIVANEVLKMPLTCGIHDPSLLDVINMTDHAIRRLIKMSKKINSFKSLCQNDQIALLKGGCTELMILRSVMSYDPERDCWQGPQGPKIMSIKVDILKEAKGNVYEEHKRFISLFDPAWRADENIMLILSAVALFTPERPNTVHKDAIKLEQDTYYYLLRRYLETVYPGCQARSIYLRLIHVIEELHILNENHVRVFLNVNPKDVEPLLIEIFDLKH